MNIEKIIRFVLIIIISLCLLSGPVFLKFWISEQGRSFDKWYNPAKSCFGMSILLFIVLILAVMTFLLCLKPAKEEMKSFIEITLISSLFMIVYVFLT